MIVGSGRIGARARTAVAAVLCVGLDACLPAPDVEPLPCRQSNPGAAEVGRGDLSSGFLPVADGADAFVQFGPQGQHMLTLSVQVVGLEPPGAGSAGNEVGVALRHQGEVVGGTVTHLFPQMQGDTASFVGLRAVFTLAEVEDIADELVDVEAGVLDGCGRRLPAHKSLRMKM